MLRKLSILLALIVFTQSAIATPLKWVVNEGLLVFPLTGSFFFDSDTSLYSMVNLNTGAGTFNLCNDTGGDLGNGMCDTGFSPTPPNLKINPTLTGPLWPTGFRPRGVRFLFRFWGETGKSVGILYIGD